MIGDLGVPQSTMPRGRDSMWKTLITPVITLLIAGFGLAAGWGSLTTRMNALEDRQRMADMYQKETRAELREDIKDIKSNIQTLLILNERQQHISRAPTSER